jgi:serine/threonine protein kinase
MLRVVETATKFYFVMELAQSDLNSYSNGISMREEEIRHILRPIFECLKYAHSHDITHRDIKVSFRKELVSYSPTKKTTPTTNEH